MDSNQQKPQRRRARKADGKFKGDNPDTPNVNEAWEPTELAESVGEKEVDYTVKAKVEGTSKPSAGKYQKKGKVRPTFGNITTTYH